MQLPARVRRYGIGSGMIRTPVNLSAYRFEHKYHGALSQLARL